VGFFFLPAGIAGGDRNHSGDPVERRFHTPEAAAGKGRFLKIGRHDRGEGHERPQQSHHNKNAVFQVALLSEAWIILSLKDLESPQGPGW